MIAKKEENVDMDTLPIVQILEDEIQKQKEKEGGMTEREMLAIACRLRDHLFNEEVTREQIAHLFTLLPH